MSALYFSLPSVSNSDFNALRKAFYCVEDAYDPAMVYKFGSLVDAMLTEPHRVNHFYFTLDDEGKVINYSPTEFELAKAMSKEAKKDPIVQQFIARGKGQHIFERDLSFEVDSRSFTIKGRCKFDSFIPGIGCSYKTTSCLTRKAFIDSIEHFHYDQQEAWYMDLAEIDRNWIIAINRRKEIFKVAVQRGDELYKRGRSRYTFWAYRWLMFIEGFKLEQDATHI